MIGKLQILLIIFSVGYFMFSTEFSFPKFEDKISCCISKEYNYISGKANKDITVENSYCSKSNPENHPCDNCTSCTICHLGHLIYLHPILDNYTDELFSFVKPKKEFTYVSHFIYDIVLTIWQPPKID